MRGVFETVAAARRSSSLAGSRSSLSTQSWRPDDSGDDDDDDGDDGDVSVQSLVGSASAAGNCRHSIGFDSTMSGSFSQTDDSGMFGCVMSGCSVFGCVLSGYVVSGCGMFGCIIELVSQLWFNNCC